MEAISVAILVGSCGAFFSAVMVPYACAPMEMNVTFFNFSNTDYYQTYTSIVSVDQNKDIRTFYCENVGGCSLVVCTRMPNQS